MPALATIPNKGQWPSALPRFRTDIYYRAFAAKDEHVRRHFQISIGGEIFDVMRPVYGYVYTFDPNTAELNDAVVFLASVIYAQKTNGSFSVVEPSGGWLRTFDPNTATMGPMFDVIATMANDLANGNQAWTIAEPPTYQRTLKTAGYEFYGVLDFLGAYLQALDSAGLI